MKKTALAASAVLALAALGWRVALRPRPVAQSAPAFDPDSVAKLAELDDLLAAKSDNDPRLDADFNALTPQTKRLFRLRYAAFPPERRNERGTIVYLLGRNRFDADDWDFLRVVVSEPPCLSLADCSRKPRSASEEAAGDSVTLAYPPLVALKQVEKRLSDPASAGPARAVLDAAKLSTTRAVARAAERLARRLP